MPWYVWGQLGLGCLVVELLLPGGFFLLLCGMPCLVIALLAAFGLVEGIGAQILIFVGLAVPSLVFVRPWLFRRLRRYPWGS